MSHISDTTAVASAAHTQENTPVQELTADMRELLALQAHLEQQYPNRCISIRQVSEKDVTTKRTVLLTRKIVCIFIFMSFFADINAKNKYTNNTDIYAQASINDRIFVAHLRAKEAEEARMRAAVLAQKEHEAEKMMAVRLPENGYLYMAIMGVIECVVGGVVVMKFLRRS